MPRPKSYNKEFKKYRKEIWDLKMTQKLTPQQIFQFYKAKGITLNNKSIQSVKAPYVETPYREFKEVAERKIIEYLQKQTNLDRMIEDYINQNDQELKKKINKQVNKQCGPMSDLKELLPGNRIETEKRRIKQELEARTLLQIIDLFLKKKQQPEQNQEYKSIQSVIATLMIYRQFKIESETYLIDYLQQNTSLDKMIENYNKEHDLELWKLICLRVNQLFGQNSHLRKLLPKTRENTEMIRIKREIRDNVFQKILDQQITQNQQQQQIVIFNQQEEEVVYQDNFNGFENDDQHISQENIIDIQGIANQTLEPDRFQPIKYGIDLFGEESCNIYQG